MNSPLQDLSERRCLPCEGITARLRLDQILQWMDSLVDWEVPEGEPARLCRTFQFRNFHETMAFANAVAWIAHAENHHPDLELSYRKCVVTWTTHAIGGLSENDFICAARVSRLISGSVGKS
jgi:4a-hydroxytetrahydrobiopterin dehydratase